MGSLYIAIDALGLPRFGGARASAIGWLAALARHGANHRYLVLLSRPEDDLLRFQNIRQKVVPLRNRFLVRIWAQLTVPSLLGREHIDLLHSMKNLGIFGAPCPTIVTVNDLTHMVLRHLYPWADGFYWQHIQPRLLQSASRIIAISENTRRDLLRFYPLSEDHVVTIYPACDERYYQPCDRGEMDRVRAKYGLASRLLLYVGGLGVHKNVITLVRAFGRVAGQIPHTLVLVGGVHHTSSDCHLSDAVAALGLSDRVRLLGSVPDEDMVPLYHVADLFLLASLNEGFGLVLVEAMACGLPVVAARAGSVPEIVDNAAWLIDDPRDDAAFGEAIGHSLADEAMRAELRARGLMRANHFSWHNTARQTLELYADVSRR